MSISSSGKRGMPSIIGPDFRVTGNVASEGDVQLDGAVEGNVKAHMLTVGEHGSIRGEVRVEKIQIKGTITGPIRAKIVEIAKTAKVTGDVFYESLTVETGAVVDGACKRADAERPVASAPPKDKDKDVAPPFPRMAATGTH